ncbi:MAG: hypothetical protein AAB522_02075 [Patescibacteria group bacterium]
MNGESLIPKKLASSPSTFIPEGSGALFRIAFIFFIAVAVLSGGLMLYRNYVVNSLEVDRATLAKLETEFDSAFVSEINRVSNSIVVAADMLDKHLKQSDIFLLLEENTTPQVFYNNFIYAHDQKSLVLLGEAASYSAIALQAGIFESLDKIESAVFSNLTLRDTGKIAFTLTLNFK